MKSNEIKKVFIDAYYDGKQSKYRKARKDDYCKVQFEWSCFIDDLCKSGIISQQQYDRATF